LRSIDCGEERGPCTGSLQVFIFDADPLPNVDDPFWGKLTAFDRHVLLYLVRLPQ
jgi:hypothetical protein